VPKSIASGAYSLFDISGKTILVTGGAHGLGRMIAGGFVQAGAKVYITSRKADQARSAAKEMSGDGNCIGLAADLSTPEGVKALTGEYADLEKHLNVLVNNAGRTWGATLEAFPDKAWAGVMAVNVQAPFTLVRELLPLLRNASKPDDPARVINIGSLAGIAVERLNAFSYSASKAAIHHLSRELAADLGHQGITVNTLVPGYFPTQMTEHIRTSPTAEAELLKRIPLGRLGTAEDISAMCILLVSRGGAYITGAELLLDGGLSGCR